MKSLIKQANEDSFEMAWSIKDSLGENFSTKQPWIIEEN
jgi:hypothetical protein